MVLMPVEFIVCVTVLLDRLSYIKVLDEGYSRTREAEKRNVEQQEPVKLRDAARCDLNVLTVNEEGTALHKLEIGVVPNAPVKSARRTEAVKHHERKARDDTAEAAHQRCAHSAALCKEYRHHGQNVHYEIQRPQRQRYVVAPAVCLDNVVNVVQEYGRQHDDGTDYHYPRVSLAQLRIEQTQLLLI